MFRYISAMIGSLLLSSAALAQPVIGQPAPAFKAVDAISGKSVSLSDFKGKLVVLEWTQPDCPFVKKFYSVGAMQGLQQKSVKDGVVWISINSSAPGKDGYLENAAAVKTAIATAKSHPSEYILDHDGSIGHLYGAKTTPHMFVIDKDGNLAYMGAIDDKPTADTADIATAHNYVALALKSLQAGTPIKTTSTRSYGCFVKY